MWYWIFMRWKCPSKAIFKGIAPGTEHLAKILSEWWINLIMCLLILSYTSLWEIPDRTSWAAWQKEKLFINLYFLTSVSPPPCMLLYSKRVFHSQFSVCFALPGQHNVARARAPESIFPYWLSKLNDPWHLDNSCNYPHGSDTFLLDWAPDCP